MDEPITLDASSLEPSEADQERLDAEVDLIADADVVYLGEANHFVHEKADFRMWWLRRLAKRRPLVVGEEMSWSAGHDVVRFLESGDARHLTRAAIFGDERYRRADRDDKPSGLLRTAYGNHSPAVRRSRALRGLRLTV